MKPTANRHAPTSHSWQPYNRHPAKPSPLRIAATDRHHLILADGRRLLDGIASWWTSIFGYNHPSLVTAVQQQAAHMAHVMYAGVEHEPAHQLAHTLASLSPATPSVFFSDSGSVAVEIALKMARQYWQALGKPDKKRFIALKNGYHGDTWGAMSVTDPAGMHAQFADACTDNLFASAPVYGMDADPAQQQPPLDDMAQLLAEHHEQLAAVIVEPIWQGAGAMNFYSPHYLNALRRLCDQYQVLLIMDEIATGFGKTGQLFAYQHSQATPDILCLGKALTGGMLTLAATCTTTAISDAISQHSPHRFMHGPTYMANPLACAAANASLSLLGDGQWQRQVSDWHSRLQSAFGQLAPCEGIRSTRALGHVGVIELDRVERASTLGQLARDKGLWIRPFGRWVYVTPAYTMPDAQREQLTDILLSTLEQGCQQPAGGHAGSDHHII